MIVYVDLAEASNEAAAFRAAVSASGVNGVALRYAPSDKTKKAEAVSDADILVGQRFDPDVLTEAAKISWISFWGAGLETAVTVALRERIARGLIVTNASGVHGPNIAEHVLAMMLAFTRRLPFYFRAQQAGVWKHDEETDRIEELAGQTLGIVGLGRIGDALAKRARAFGMRVVGVKRDVTQRHDPSSPVDHLYRLADLHLLLAESDHVCIALPSTAETHHLINADRFAQMKKTARLYNIARGAIVDEEALVRALDETAIAGAGLDVFEEEPLAPSSPLWKMENVILTPHVSGVTPHYFERAAAIFGQNLALFARSETLRNRFDPSRGY
ncbi:MAG: D-2-hydroxyacid dehydrogenase [Polyangiaceae bacterium]